MKICIVALCFGMIFAVHFAAADGPDYERMRAPLVSAGILITEPSLIDALHNDNKIIATAAADVLPTLGTSPRMISSLYSVLDDPFELLLVVATRSLFALGETSWEQQDATRLPKMQDEVEKLLMCGLLAQVNNTEGWPIILSHITSGQLVGIALENVSYFEGKLYIGEAIDVRRELEQAITVAPIDARRQIQAKIDSLKKWLVRRIRG